MSQTFYRGADGLDYLTQADADICGGGCIGKKIVGNVEVVALDDVEEKTSAENQKVAAEPAKPGFNTATASLDDIREIARQRKVKGWAIIKDKDKLIEKIKETVAKK